MLPRPSSDCKALLPAFENVPRWLWSNDRYTHRAPVTLTFPLSFPDAAPLRTVLPERSLGVKCRLDEASPKHRSSRGA